MSKEIRKKSKDLLKKRRSTLTSVPETVVNVSEILVNVEPKNSVSEVNEVSSTLAFTPPSTPTDLLRKNKSEKIEPVFHKAIFFHVVVGKDIGDEILVNADCSVGIMLDFIRFRILEDLYVPTEARLELFDEYGRNLQLSEVDVLARGTDYVVHRGVYFPMYYYPKDNVDADVNENSEFPGEGDPNNTEKYFVPLISDTFEESVEINWAVAARHDEMDTVKRQTDVEITESEDIVDFHPSMLDINRDGGSELKESEEIDTEEKVKVKSLYKKYPPYLLQSYVIDPSTKPTV